MAQFGTKGARTKNLSTRISLFIGGILVVVFTILIAFSVSTNLTAMSGSISDEFFAMAKNSGLEVYRIITNVKDAAQDIEAYINKAYQYSTQGKRNMLGQDYAAGQTKAGQYALYNSVIYGTPVSEMSSDVEKYIIETARQVAVRNSEVENAGVMFEPYAFEEGIADYAFLINELDGEKPVQPFGTYASYSKEEYYQEAVRAKKAVFTEPYDFNGTTMVTYSIPVYNNGALQCVVMMDLDVTTFSQASNTNAKYPSMYTTILDEDGTVIYDTEDVQSVGKSLESFMSNSKEIEQMKAGMSAGQEFSTTITEEGQVNQAFFYPIDAGDSHWWAVTALKRSEMNQTATNSAFWLIVISVASLLIIATLIASILRRSLQPIGELVHAANRISNGDLNVTVHARSQDEIGQLATAFETTVERLKFIIDDTNFCLGEMANGNFDVKSRDAASYIGNFADLLNSMRKINIGMSRTMIQINQAAEQVSSGSEQVSSGAQALSQGATEQASSVEELAATITEISDKVRGNAMDAQEASEKARHVGDEIIASNQQMHQMIAAMNEISSSSAQIGKIIKTIEDIAFQTNILALNAAVEAARAGAAGKGFAVVADEVRNLANKSSEASKNTADLIENSIQSVEKGTKIADETARSLMSVLDGAKEVVTTMNRISEASGDQASSIAQVTQGVDQISAVVQTNSATAEESAAASEELSSQAQMLREMMYRFTMRDTELIAMGLTVAPKKAGRDGREPESLPLSTPSLSGQSKY